MSSKVIHSCCLDAMQDMADCSIDAIVTDPPYGLGFMGKHWDYGVPGVDFWAEMLRVLKPGGHLLAFSGSRTYHRMTCAIEDAGFEVRDQIMWVYGSGFPKSHNLKDEWQGWGTAMKPAFEPLCVAQKPLPESMELDTINANLLKLEARLWLLSFANAAEKNSTLSPNELSEAFAIAQWTADELTSTQDDLCEVMGMSQYVLVINTCLSIVTSWRNTLGAICKLGNTSTTETKSSMTTDWKILNFCLSQITPRTITTGLSIQHGLIAHAFNAERYFDAELKKFNATLELSALAPAISQDRQNCLDVDGKVKHEPICVARKPLIGTVAENVLEFGTGALNIDGCRVTDGSETGGERPAYEPNGKNAVYGAGAGGGAWANTNGRWPANLIHDGSDEVLAAFPDAPGQQGDLKETGRPRPSSGRFGDMSPPRAHAARIESDKSAARFFYCAKASKKDRNEGCDHIAAKQYSYDGRETPIDNAYQRNSSNSHPTVKPTDLMRYLCRLVTPPGGVVLDPFMGSGSTGKAAILEGFSFIGIEAEAEYVEIAKARILKAEVEHFDALLSAE